MKKETFWKRGALVLAAALLTLAVFTACPTDGDNDSDPLPPPPPAPGSLPGLYMGDDLVTIDLSEVEVDVTVKTYEVDSSTKTYKKPTDLSANGGPSVLDKALKWLSTNAADSTKYTIVIGEDLTYTPVIDLELWGDHSMWQPHKYLLGGIQINSNTLNGKQNITLVIKSVPEGVKTIRLNTVADQQPAYLLKVGTFYNYDPDGDKERKINVVLENINLRGLSGTVTSKAPMNFVVGRGATFTVGEGAVVGYHHNKRDEVLVEWGGDGFAGNYSSNAWGGGFAVLAGNLIVDGGTIRNCIAETTVTGSSAYGAVAFMNNASEKTSLFLVKKGLITKNEVISEGGAYGGVATFYNWGDENSERCMFQVEGGEISENTITGKTTVSGSVIGNHTIGNQNNPAESIKITGGVIKNNKAEQGADTVSGYVFPGFYIQGLSYVYLGGSPDIQDPFALTETNRTITVLDGFTPVNPIKVDFYANANYNDDLIPTTKVTAFTNKPIAKLAEGATGDLSTKFVANNWLYRHNGTTAGFYTKPVTEITFGADGTTVAAE